MPKCPAQSGSHCYDFYFRKPCALLRFCDLAPHGHEWWNVENSEWETGMCSQCGKHFPGRPRQIKKSLKWTLWAQRSLTLTGHQHKTLQWWGTIFRGCRNNVLYTRLWFNVWLSHHNLSLLRSSAHDEIDPNIQCFQICKWKLPIMPWGHCYTTSCLFELAADDGRGSTVSVSKRQIAQEMPH